MCALNLQSKFDPFADEAADELPQANTSNYIHIRIQQRNGRKSLTTVTGLPADINFRKVLKALKKVFCCNGTVVSHEELGEVLQLQGDQRRNVAQFLVDEKIVKKELIKVHGF